MHQHKGLQAIATLEACKGVIATFAGLGFIALLHENLQDIAERVLFYIGVSAHQDLAEWVLHELAKVTEDNILEVSIFALSYATLRFTEAYGLWHERRWAEWLAALSSSIYLPFELIELWEEFGWLKLSILVFNLGVIAYMVYVLRQPKPIALVD